MVDLEGSVRLETLEAHIIEEPKGVLCMGTESSLMDPIIHYLNTRTLSDNDLATRKVKHQVSHYVMLDKKLYKRSYTFPLPRCLPPSKVDNALREVHEGIYDNHLGGRALSYKILW